MLQRIIVLATALMVGLPIAARAEVASHRVMIDVKFHLVVPHGALTDVEFDYSSSPPTALLLEGHGPIPFRGSLHYSMPGDSLRFLARDSGTLLKSYDFKTVQDDARRELARLGGSPAEKLRRGELLHLLGEDAAAIPELALLVAATSLPRSTRDFASLQLGRAFAAIGDKEAALDQFNRVAHSPSPAARSEALLRRSSLLISLGQDTKAKRSIDSYNATATAGMPSSDLQQARVNNQYVSAMSRFRQLHATALNILDGPDEDAKDSDFQALPGTPEWKYVDVYPLLVQRLWQEVFRTSPVDLTCRSVYYCTTTSYWGVRNQIDGRFARVAFRIVRWYASPGAAKKNGYKLEYAAQEASVDCLNCWAPVKNAAVQAVVRNLLNDLQLRLRLLGGS